MRSCWLDSTVLQGVSVRDWDILHYSAYVDEQDGRPRGASEIAQAVEDEAHF